MDKRLILAVAGSGKTSLLVSKLDLNRRFLLLTYTNNNCANLRTKIIKKFGFFPENIKLLTYFSFLYGFCFKPFLLTQTGVKGINFQSRSNRFAREDDRYIDSMRCVYANRLAKFIEIKGMANSVSARIDKYFDVIMIDEIQDLSGNDFSLLPHVSVVTCDVMFVGDFFQHTYDTSRDGAINRNLHNELSGYVKRFSDMGLTIDTETLNKSFRCSPSICKYITDNLGITIDSHRDDNTLISLIESNDNARALFADKDVIKLFYKDHYTYSCHSQNWGASKGEDCYNDVCVALNATTYKALQESSLNQLPPSTRNKLYVAMTRARGKVFFIEERVLKQFA